ncbi:MAG: hypothetical protein QXL79_05705 [Sulfolobales archaeon]
MTGLGIRVRLGLGLIASETLLRLGGVYERPITSRTAPGMLIGPGILKLRAVAVPLSILENGAFKCNPNNQKTEKQIKTVNCTSLGFIYTLN